MNRGVERAVMVISNDQALLFNVNMRNGLAMVKEGFSLRAILSNEWSLATTRALSFNVYMRNGLAMVEERFSSRAIHSQMLQRLQPLNNLPYHCNRDYSFKESIPL